MNSGGAGDAESGGTPSHAVKYESVRFWLQTMDATANPHLALAAIATAGLLGLRRGGKLPHPVQVSGRECVVAACAWLQTFGGNDIRGSDKSPMH